MTTASALECAESQRKRTILVLAILASILLHAVVLAFAAPTLIETDGAVPVTSRLNSAASVPPINELMCTIGAGFQTRDATCPRCKNIHPEGAPCPSKAGTSHAPGSGEVVIRASATQGGRPANSGPIALTGTEKQSRSLLGCGTLPPYPGPCPKCKTVHFGDDVSCLLRRNTDINKVRKAFESLSPKPQVKRPDRLPANVPLPE